MAGQAMTSMASWAAMASMVETASMPPRCERFPRACWRSRATEASPASLVVTAQTGKMA